MSRSLPERPNLDHLKNEAKALLKTLRVTNAAAKLTAAQRQLAREYGFPTWAALRQAVQSRLESPAAHIATFLAAMQEQDWDRAVEISSTHPGILQSIHVQAALGNADAVRAMVAERPALANEKAGNPSATPLLCACFSPRSREPGWEKSLAETVRVLLAAGADPNTKDGRFGVPALYGVTGMHNVPGVARLLLEAGANPTDGESAFHAAEKYHVESLELLKQFGVDLNQVGEWGNTPLYYLLHWYDLETHEKPRLGFQWLLAHGADPNVACGKERENSLQVAVRRGQSLATIEQLLAHGARLDLRRGDGATAWMLAKRAGYDDIATRLERAGANPERLAPADELLAACGRGDVGAARALADVKLIASLGPSDQLLLNEAAAAGRARVVEACLAAGFDVNRVNDRGATALHEAAISGYVDVVRSLLGAGADHRIKDPHHHSTPMGWAQFGADFVQNPKGRYEDTVRALLDAGAEVRRDEHVASHEGVRRASASG